MKYSFELLYEPGVLLHLGERDALIWLYEDAPEEILSFSVDTGGGELRELVAEVADLLHDLVADLLIKPFNNLKVLRAVCKNIESVRVEKGPSPVEELKDGDSKRPNVYSPIVEDLIMPPLQ